MCEEFVDSALRYFGFTTYIASADGDTVTLTASGQNVTGGAGNDTINGGPGTHTVSGGAGADTFNVTAGTVTITLALADGSNDNGWVVLVGLQQALAAGDFV